MKTFQMPGIEKLFHASPVGVGFSVDRVLHEVNDRLCEMTGYAREELVGQSLRLLHPSDAAFEAVGRQVYPALAEKGFARIETKLRRKNGEVLDVSLSIAQVSPGEPAGGVIATVLDITDYLRTQAELRAARARLEVALQAGNLGLYEAELMSDTVWVDERFLGQLGLPPDAAMSMERWLGLLHPDDRERLRAATALTINGDISEFDAEYRIRHAAGGWRWLIDRWRVYAHDAEGKILRVAGVHLDITDRKVAEEELAELNRVLERRVAERTAEVARQAQQLRALAFRLAQAEQLERKRIATLLHDHLQQLIVAAQIQVNQAIRATNPGAVQAAAQSATQVLQEALDASRSLTVELSPPVLYERGLAGGLDWLGRRMREQHGLRIRLHADPAAEPDGDEARFLLFECARELLLNVVKHAEAEQADLTLVRPAPGEIHLKVADSGKGFDPDALKELRADAMHFGLFSIQERIAHLGGRMELESAPGRGASVTLVLPNVDGPAPEARTESVPGQGPRPIQVGERARRYRVLIVDDHRMVREGLAGLLQVEPEIDVVGGAENGTQAVALAEELTPDVVVMDINLGPGIDGVEATRRILSANPGIKVIGLSMHIDEDVAAAMVDAGAAVYLSKGGPPEGLIDAIRKCCGS